MYRFMCNDFVYINIFLGEEVNWYFVSKNIIKHTSTLIIKTNKIDLKRNIFCLKKVSVYFNEKWEKRVKILYINEVIIIIKNS